MRNSNSEQDAINRDIQAAMMRVNDIYAAIGRKYYSENSQNQVPAEYSQMFNDLKATCTQIENMQTRIKFLNGIVVCTNCKADNSVNSSFCAVCGTRLPHTFAQDGSLRCSRCGNLLKPGQKFCGVCGNVAEAATVAAQSAAGAGFVPQGGFSQQGGPAVQDQQNPEARFMPQDQPVVQSEPVPQETPAQPGAEKSGEVSESAVTQENITPDNTPESSATSDAAQQTGPAACPQCGAPIKAPDALFCAECGYRLR